MLVAIHEEAAREVNQLLGRGFAQRHEVVRTGLQTVEYTMRAGSPSRRSGGLKRTTAVRSPAEDRWQMLCQCGQQAQYQEIRSKGVLTIVGPMRNSRPSTCVSHEGQFRMEKRPEEGF